nr:hypothetical protein CFP56_39010 [Quercus suber]
MESDAELRQFSTKIEFRLGTKSAASNGSAPSPYFPLLSALRWNNTGFRDGIQICTGEAKSLRCPTLWYLSLHVRSGGLSYTDPYGTSAMHRGCGEAILIDGGDDINGESFNTNESHKSATLLREQKHNLLITYMSDSIGISVRLHAALYHDVASTGTAAAACYDCVSEKGNAGKNCLVTTILFLMLDLTVGIDIAPYSSPVSSVLSVLLCLRHSFEWSIRLTVAGDSKQSHETVSQSSGTDINQAGLVEVERMCPFQDMQGKHNVVGTGISTVPSILPHSTSAALDVMTTAVAPYQMGYGWRIFSSNRYLARSESSWSAA